MIIKAADPPGERFSISKNGRPSESWLEKPLTLQERNYQYPFPELQRATSNHNFNWNPYLGIPLWSRLSRIDFFIGFHKGPYSTEESSASGSPEDVFIRLLIKTLIQRRRFQLLAAQKICPWGFNSSPYSKEEISASGSPEDFSLGF